MVVESMGEGVDKGLQLIDSLRQIVGGIELISPGRLGTLDAAVEVGALRRQHEEFEAARLAFGFEDGFELGSAIDLNAPDGEGRLSDELGEQRLGAGCARSCGDAADGPLGDRVIGGEMLDRLVGP
jgi:hypothetical protein